MAPQHAHRVSRTARRALAVWATAVTTGVVIGASLNAAGRNIVLPTPPILGSFNDGVRLTIVLPVIVGAVLVVATPRLAARARWGVLLALTPVLSLAWAFALALAEGPGALTRGPRDHTEYLTDVPSVRAGAGDFLRGFVENIDRYEIHVRGHPPGMVLLLAGLDRVGLGGAGWEAALILLAAATAPVAVMLAVRDVAGEVDARRSCAWLVLAPAAVWIATSADALYMAVGAWAVTCVVLATSERHRRSTPYAALGGLLWGAALLGSYGLLLLAPIPAAVVWSRRATAPVVRVALVTTLAAALVLAALLPFGFWWPAGLLATRHEYLVLDIDRPYWAFVFINLAAWAVALGPATAVGLAHIRHSALRLIVGGGLAAAALAGLSGLSSGEVERIWLPFTIWVLPAGALLSSSSRRERRGLALQAASAIVLISVVTTQW